MNSRMTSSIPSDPKITLEIELERLYNKNQLIPRLRREFLNDKTVNISKYMVSKGINPDFGLDLMVQLVLHKRTSLPIMVGILRYYVPEGASLQPIADMILKCCEADLCDWSPVNQQLIVRFTISPELQEELDQYQFPLPMITSPRKLRSNRDTPYVVVRDGSVILRHNHHDEDVCLDHLNKVNNIKFSLNNDVAQMVRNKWRNLDKAKPNEKKEDFEKRKRAFEKYDRTALAVMRQVTSLGNEFYLTHKYDKRGRVYCQGYHINYQGAPWNKAVIELSNKELCP